MRECGARVHFKGRLPGGFIGDAHLGKRLKTRVLEEQQPRELNKYALCTQKQIIKKPVVVPERVSLYKSFTEKFTDGYQNIPLQNLVFITDKLNHVPFRIHRINYFQGVF